MGIELRVKEDGRIECGWGVIEIGNQWFKREDVMPLLLIDVTRVQHLLADGPQTFTCWWDGKQIPATNDVKRDGDCLFYHAHFDDDHFVYELHEAHWAGTQGPAGYVGRWLD